MAVSRALARAMKKKKKENDEKKRKLERKRFILQNKTFIPTLRHTQSVGTHACARRHTVGKVTIRQRDVFIVMT